MAAFSMNQPVKTRNKVINKKRRRAMAGRRTMKKAKKATLVRKLKMTR
jgi:hypothetical protein